MSQVLYDFDDGHIVAISGGTHISELIEVIIDLAKFTGKTYTIKFSQKTVTVCKNDTVEASYQRWKEAKKG